MLAWKCVVNLCTPIIMHRLTKFRELNVIYLQTKFITRKYWNRTIFVLQKFIEIKVVLPKNCKVMLYTQNHSSVSNYDANLTTVTTFHLLYYFPCIKPIALTCEVTNVNPFQDQLFWGCSGIVVEKEGVKTSPS